MRYQQNKTYRYTGYAKSNGAPVHYIVHLVKGNAKIKAQDKTITILQASKFQL